MTPGAVVKMSFAPPLHIVLQQQVAGQGQGLGAGLHRLQTQSITVLANRMSNGLSTLTRGCGSPMHAASLGTWQSTSAVKWVTMSDRATRMLQRTMGLGERPSSYNNKVASSKEGRLLLIRCLWRPQRNHTRGAGQGQWWPCQTGRPECCSGRRGWGSGLRGAAAAPAAGAGGPLRGGEVWGGCVDNGLRSCVPAG